MGAAGPGAAVVAFGESVFLGGAEQALLAAEVEDFTVPAEDHRDQVGVGGEPTGGAGADRGGDLVDLGGAGPGAQVVQGRPGRSSSPVGW